MIALDLSPRVLAPRRGVARALETLLEALALAPPAGERWACFAPPSPPGTPRPALPAGLPATLRELAAPTRGAWRRALAQAAAEAGARLLVSPYAAIPRTPLPVVAWVHEVPWRRHGALEGRVRTARHAAALARVARRAAGVVVPSHAVAADLLAVHPSLAGRVHVVAHGFVPPAAPAAPAPRDGGLLLLGSGRGAGGARKKGVDLFLRLLADPRLAALQGTLVGEPGRRLAPAARALGARLAVLAEPSDGEVQAELARARLLLVPSRSEGFGFPVLEGFAAGVPVLAAAAGALPEVAGGAALLLPPGGLEAWVAGVLRVEGDAALRARLVAAGAARAREFPPAAMAAGWRAALQAALRQAGSRGPGAGA